jgi:hypothetical protein
MSLFAGSIYSSPGVVQAGIKGGQPLPQENFSTVIVSTCTVAEETLAKVKSDVSNNTEGATVTVRLNPIYDETGVITVKQISTFSIAGFNGVVDIPNITNINGLITRTIENVSSIGGLAGGFSFSPDASVTQVLNMNVSSINSAGPVTYTIEPTAPDSLTAWSTFSTTVTTLVNLDPTRLYNVSYTGRIPTMVAPSVSPTDTFFFTANSATGTQYSSVPLQGIVDLCAGPVSSFSIADTFSCRPRPDSTITLKFGAAATYDANNVFLINYDKILVTNLGVTPV